MLHQDRQLLNVRLLASAGLLFACLLQTVAWAADADANPKNQAPITVNLKQFKVVQDAKGETKLLDAGVVVPGDVLEYQATYSNRGTVPLTVSATLPVPEALEYLKDSARSKPALSHTVALKDNQFAQEPLVRKQTAANGTTLLQPIPYAEYRFVRWDLGKLAPGSSAEVSIRAQVSQNTEGDGAAKK